jgi:hypothetical protein
VRPWVPPGIDVYSVHISERTRHRNAIPPRDLLLGELDQTAAAVLEHRDDDGRFEQQWDAVRSIRVHDREPTVLAHRNVVLELERHATILPEPSD